MSTPLPKRECAICHHFFYPEGVFTFRCPRCVTEKAGSDEHPAVLEATNDFKRRQWSAWEAMCPPDYRESDLARLPVAAVKAAEAYTLGPRALAFIGPARIGKTRTMFRLMRWLIAAGHLHGQYIYGPQFSSEVATCGAEFGKFLRPLLICPFLFFDDIGAGRYTPAVESNLLLLLETRSSYQRPTFWTSNVGPTGLASMLSKENGPRIIGRLKDFSTTIQL